MNRTNICATLSLGYVFLSATLYAQTTGAPDLNTLEKQIQQQRAHPTTTQQTTDADRDVRARLALEQSEIRAAADAGDTAHALSVISVWHHTLPRGMAPDPSILLLEAKLSEKTQDYERAVRAVEQLAANAQEGSPPYKEAMAIYPRLKDHLQKQQAETAAIERERLQKQQAAANARERERADAERKAESARAEQERKEQEHARKVENALAVEKRSTEEFDKFFSANESGRVVDVRTGRVWSKVDNKDDISWKGARAYCEGLKGFLPTVGELQTLVGAGPHQCGLASSCKTPVAFDLTSYWFWSSDVVTATEVASVGLVDGFRRVVNVERTKPLRALCVMKR
jgi:hypothetical protein